MLKPFQILWELIEFALQALFIYVLAVILCIGLIVYVIADKKKVDPEIQYVYEKVIIEKEVKKTIEKQCDRIAGCRVLEDGSVEY